MNRRYLAFALVLCPGSLVLAEPAAAEMVLSGYGGYQIATDSDVTVSGTNPANFTARWKGKSFAMPPYWGVRGIWWMEELGTPEFGVSLDYTHAKVYADNSTLRRSGWSHFEFTDGLNLLTLNALYRFQQPERRWSPYLGLGAGINVPHVEVTRPSGKTFKYAFGGATLQAQAGISYQITERWSAFAEYKANYSFVDVDIDGGDRLETEIFTNAINVGVAFHF